MPQTLMWAKEMLYTTEILRLLFPLEAVVWGGDYIHAYNFVYFFTDGYMFACDIYNCVVCVPVHCGCDIERMEVKKARWCKRSFCLCVVFIG